MSPRRTAFTLAELMVVVTIIALLVAIVMPFFNRVFAVQRKVACQNNLEKLGQAIGVQVANRMMRGMLGTGLGTREWQQELFPWVSRSKDVFHCPEDDGTGMGKKASLAGYYMDIYPGNAYAGSICLNEEEGEWVWKLSQTQWNTFRDMAARNGRQSHGYVHPGYKPDGNPNLYFFAFEDMKWSGGADRDFFDINFKLETNGVDVKITVLNGVTGYNHYLYQGPPGDPNRKRLFPGTLKNYDGQSIVAQGDPHSNYGMNSVGGEIRPASGDKLMILDYELLLAAGSPMDESSGDRAAQLKELWTGDPKNPKAPLKFARHLKQCNVLFADGSVELMTTDEVHPEDPQACLKYWNP